MFKLFNGWLFGAGLFVIAVSLVAGLAGFEPTIAFPYALAVVFGVALLSCFTEGRKKLEDYLTVAAGLGFSVWLIYQSH